MNLQDKVASYELSNELRTLGVNLQNTYFTWYEYLGEYKDHDPFLDARNECSALNSNLFMTPAPLPCELLEVMPELVDGTDLFVQKNDIDNSYSCIYSFDFDDSCTLGNMGCFPAKSLANALAKCLIWLIKNKYVEVVDGKAKTVN
jgi:hypothetical protein